MSRVSRMLSGVVCFGLCAGVSLGAAGTSQTGAPAMPLGGGDPAAPGGAAQPQGMGSLGLMFPLLIGFMLLMIVMSFTAGRKQKKERAELLGSLANKDRVQTAGGLIGTVVEMKENEVRLKIDDSSDVRVWFNKDSVTSVLKKGKGSSLEPASEEV